MLETSTQLQALSSYALEFLDNLPCWRQHLRRLLSASRDQQPECAAKAVQQGFISDTGTKHAGSPAGYDSSTPGLPFSVDLFLSNLYAAEAPDEVYDLVAKRCNMNSFNSDTGTKQEALLPPTSPFKLFLVLDIVPVKPLCSRST